MNFSGGAEGNQEMPVELTSLRAEINTGDFYVKWSATHSTMTSVLRSNYHSNQSANKFTKPGIPTLTF
jgi:hypothetical protein